MLVGDVIGQFEFVKVDDFGHPLLAGGRTVGVNVHPFGHFRISLSRHHPARVMKLIPAVISRDNIHQQNIFGLFVQARASDFKRREHAPAEKTRDQTKDWPRIQILLFYCLDAHYMLGPVIRSALYPPPPPPPQKKPNKNHKNSQLFNPTIH